MSVRHTVCLLAVLAALLVTASPLAELRTTLEPRLVDEMDTIRLTIRQEGGSQSDAPDLTPLMEDFEVLGSQTSSRISSINGRTVASVEYQISLRPQRTGELSVPSLTIGGEQSESIVIRVRPLDPSVKKAIASRVFFETELSSNPVYVQAETVLSRRLFYSQGVQIYSDLPGVPEITDAVVIPLGETQSRSVLRGGRRYGVIEQRFALFPERSGSLIIPAISVTSSVQLSSQGRTRRSGIRVATEEIMLDVLPIPDAYPPDVAWLPATGVSLDQLWVPSVNQADVGDPLRFEVTVRAEGNRGSAIPPVPLPLPADRFKIYPEAPDMAESADTGSVVGVRQERYALIPTAPGNVAVPDLTVTWWDTELDSLRESRVTVASLDITGTAPAPEPVPETPSVAPAQPPPTAATQTRSAGLPWQTVLTVGLGSLLLCAVLILAGRQVYRHLAHLRSRFPALDRQVVRKRRRRLSALRAATRGGDLSEYRRALGAYLAGIYDTSTTSALQRFREEANADALLNQLERAVYAERGADTPAGSAGNQPGHSIDLNTLTALARTADRNQRVHRNANGLPGLYS